MPILVVPSSSGIKNWKEKLPRTEKTFDLCAKSTGYLQKIDSKSLAVAGYSDSFFTIVDDFVNSRETARVNLVQEINSVVIG